MQKLRFKLAESDREPNRQSARLPPHINASSRRCSDPQWKRGGRQIWKAQWFRDARWTNVLTGRRCWLRSKRNEASTASANRWVSAKHGGRRPESKESKQSNIGNMPSRIKDIAFSPPFLRCCPASPSSPCRVWTPADTEEAERHWVKL